MTSNTSIEAYSHLLSSPRDPFRYLERQTNYDRKTCSSRPRALKVRFSGSSREGEYRINTYSYLSQNNFKLVPGHMSGT